jgi:hypothetical protein
MIHQSKFVEMIKVLEDCHSIMAREAFHADKTSLEEVESLKCALKDHKDELNLILQIDISDKVNAGELIAQIALDAYTDAENTVQQVKTFLRRKI